MKLIKPFAGLRPGAQYVKEIIAPPYDIVSVEQARKLAAGNRYSFLHISKPEIDLPEDTDPYSDIVYQTGAKNFGKFLKQKILQPDTGDCYYVYRLTEAGQQQTGLVAAASIKAYLKDDIKKHENTRPTKETDRVKNIEALNAQASPVMLAFRHDVKLDKLLMSFCTTKPIYHVTDHQHVLHEFWMIDDAEQIELISKKFNKLDELYIADGHHRIAAAARVAEQRDVKDDDPANSFLAVLFPDNQLNILGYHRLFKDLNSLTTEQFLHAIKPVFTITESNKPVQPNRKGQIGLYLDHQWYLLHIKPDFYKGGKASNTLEVNILRENIVIPILDITDPRNDKRVEFVGGEHAIEELQQRVDSGESAVAFTLYPTSMEELMKVSDNKETMPPKSTWFEPKLADGLISYLLTQKQP